MELQRSWARPVSKIIYHCDFKITIPNFSLRDTEEKTLKLYFTKNSEYQIHQRDVHEWDV